MNIMEYAIEREKEGENFYRSQVDKNKGTGLSVIFATLADDEKMHAEILEGFFKDKNIELPDDLSYSRLPGSNEELKKHFETNLKQVPDQLDIYREALVKEKESIDLYRSFLDKSNDIRDTKLFGFLIEQEEAHHTTIENIIYHLEKAESWVESAEFGVREDY